jgi:oligopeptide/dipeptide ABC transporter ATP-binding protein
VGESGSGKTTTARLILRLAAADRGSVEFDGTDWLALPRRELDRRRREVGVVFQDPATSLDPRLTIGEIVAEPLAIHAIGSRAGRREKAADLVASVGLPASALARHPSELSGGQQQRVAIARALATEPRLVVLDEPVTAALFSSPRHPYTALLLASRPRETPGPRAAPRPYLGEPPSPAAPPSGCPFHPRCTSVRPVCSQEVPALVAGPAEGGRSVACHAPLGGD